MLYAPRDLRIQEDEIGQLQSNQILVQTGACGICGSDIECYEGHLAEGIYDIAPYTPGHEWAGKVVEVGKDAAKRFRIGDKVL